MHALPGARSDRAGRCVIESGSIHLALRSADLTRAQRVEEIVLLVLFMVMLVLSFVTTPLFGLKPLLVEAFVNIGVVVLGVQYAWQFFTSGPSKDN